MTMRTDRCAFCGEPIESSANFCPSCGRPHGTRAAPAGAGGPRPGHVVVERRVGSLITVADRTYELAEFGTRAAGALIDWALWGALWYALVMVIFVTIGFDFAYNESGQLNQAALDESTADLSAAFLIVYIVVAALGFAANWLFNSIGWSIGKRIVGVRIIDEQASAPGVLRGLGRTVTAWFSGAILGVGYLCAAGDDRNQTWHDKAAQTYVVRARPVDPNDASRDPIAAI